MCNVTGIVYKVEEFRQPVSVRQCFNCQSFGNSAQNCKSKQKCVICGENHSHKGCPKKEAKQPKCANCSGPVSGQNPPGQNPPDKIPRTKSPWTKSPWDKILPGQNPPGQNPPSIFYFLLTVIYFINSSK